MIRQVTAATYLQVWWPQHDEPVYGPGHLPVWDHKAEAFTDPGTGTVLVSWANVFGRGDRWVLSRRVDPGEVAA